MADSICPGDLQPSSGTRGAISELVVSTDLLRRNLPTFRALSPSCPCDLVVLIDGRVLRIEVRTAVISQFGLVQVTVGERDKGRFDVLAAVCGDAPYYYPHLFGQGQQPALSRSAHIKLAAWGLLDGPAPPEPSPLAFRSTVKLTVEAVSLIKRDLAQGVSKEALARQHGVTWQAINAISAGRNWASVGPAEETG